MPSPLRNEVLVTLGIILVLLAILVPVVRTVRASAQRAEEMHRQSADPLMLEE